MHVKFPEISAPERMHISQNISGNLRLPQGTERTLPVGDWSEHGAQIESDQGLAQLASVDSNRIRFGRGRSYLDFFLDLTVWTQPRRSRPGHPRVGS